MIKIYCNLHWVKDIWYRLTEGIGCCELTGWNYYTSKRIARELKLFKERTYSFPHGFKNLEEWRKTIQEIIDGFEIMGSDAAFSEDWKKYEKQTDKALKLFARHYKDMWI